MAIRALSAPTIAALSASQVEFVHLIKVQTGVATRYWTTSAATITYNSQIYLATGDIRILPSVSEGARLNMGSLILEVSTINATNLNLLLTENHLRYPVEILAGILDLSDGSLISAITVFRGVIDKIALSENPGSGDSKLQISTSSVWARLNNPKGRQNTVESQQRVFPTDLGFDHAAGLDDLKITWGVDT